MPSRGVPPPPTLAHRQVLAARVVLGEALSPAVPACMPGGSGSPGFQPLNLVTGFQVNICSIDNLPVSSPWKPERQQEALLS